MLEIFIHPTELSVKDFADSIMKKRVAQGYPEEVLVKIGEQPSVAYDWTDGIQNITSVFFSETSNSVKEFCIVQRGNKVLN